MHKNMHKKEGLSEANGADGVHPSLIDSASIKNPFVIPGIKKVKIDSQLNPQYRFDNFIEGDCNKLARNAGHAVADRPGETAFNPLFIFGDVGLGKTHLAQAIGNEIQNNLPNKSVLYISSEKFTNQIIQAIRNNAINDFVNFYQMVDVLIVDDIQFLANKKKTQEIFFQIFNQLHQKRKQLILTSDRPAKDVDGMEDRLISRFKWGLNADLQIPEYETRMAILKAKTEEEHTHIDDDILEYIAINTNSNIRELEGILVSLLAQASLNKKAIDIQLAKGVLKNFVTQLGKEVTIDSIKQVVSDHMGVSVEKIEGKTRKREVVIARQICMYMVKNMTAKSLKNIGEAFGGRDHSTVIYSCNMVADQMEIDEDFKNDVEAILKKLSLNKK